MKTHRQLRSIPAPLIRRVLGLAFATAAICLPLTASAATYYVGTCKPGRADFTTITQAVNTVPVGSIIDVCPGTYPEQVYLWKPLTLQGIQSGDGASVTIAAPPANAVFGYNSPLGSYPYGLIPQILVESTSGPVNISGIVVDGTGVSSLPYFLPAVVSILYVSTSGTIDHVVTQNLPQGFKPLNDTGTTAILGILAADPSSESPTVTVKNSFVNMPTDGLTESGIQVPSGSPSGIILNVANTSLLLTGTASGGLVYGVDDEAGTGTLSGNTISALWAGVMVANGSYSITDNTISDAFIAVQDNGTTATEVTGNTLFNDDLGISSYDPNITIKGNQFYQSISNYSAVGIDFNCTSPAAISGNAFGGSSPALNNVPSGTSLKGTAGTFFGVPTIEQLCGN